MDNRDTGIDSVGEVSWGAHICMLYKSKYDLKEILMPYFLTGLHNNESCLWIIPDTMDIHEAEENLRYLLVGYDDYVDSGQLQIVKSEDWYFDGGDTLNPVDVLMRFGKKEADALNAGFDGLRLAGSADPQWLGVHYLAG